MYDERERNLRANPTLLRTNLPWRLYLLIAAIPVLLIVGWRYWAPAITVKQTDLSVLGEKATVTVELLNRSKARAGITLEVSVGWATTGSDASPREFIVSARRKISVFLDAGSERTIVAEFESLPGHRANHAEARIVEVGPPVR